MELQPYIKGEEKFGAITSKLYSAFAHIALDRMYNLVVDDLVKLHPKSILEVGSGPGDLAIKLSKRMPSSIIYCVDPSVYMRKIALKKIEKHTAKNIIYLTGSSRHVPLKRRFNVIISTLSFHHWMRKKESLLYLASLLNQKGKILIYEYDRERLRYPFRLFLGGHSLDIDDIKNLNISGLAYKINKRPPFLSVEFYQRNQGNQLMK